MDKHNKRITDWRAVMSGPWRLISGPAEYREQTRELAWACSIVVASLRTALDSSAAQRLGSHRPAKHTVVATVSERDSPKHIGAVLR
jgi:hypothetical protein